MSKKISEVMTSHIHTIGSDQTIEHAKKVMVEFGIQHLPVLKGGQLRGILTDRDIKLAYAVDGTKAAPMKITDVCQDEVYTADTETPLSEVASEMYKRHIGCCVITDQREKVVGIFTVTDACRLLSNLAK